MQLGWECHPLRGEQSAQVISLTMLTCTFVLRFPVFVGRVCYPTLSESGSKPDLQTKFNIVKLLNLPLAHLARNLIAQVLTNRVQWNTFQHWLKEPIDD